MLVSCHVHNTRDQAERISGTSSMDFTHHNIIIYNIVINFILVTIRIALNLDFSFLKNFSFTLLSSILLLIYIALL